MRAAPTLLAFQLVAAFSGCTCAGKDSAGDAATTEGADAAASAPSKASRDTSAPLSAPIAAAHLPDGSILVVGLVVPRAALALLRVDSAGNTVWTHDVLLTAGWAPDAEARVYAGADGSAFVYWKGLHAGKPVRELVSVAPDGQSRGEPEEVGPTVCATSDGPSWIVRRPDRLSHLFTRGWTDAKSHELFVYPSDVDPSVACGEHRTFALMEGDDTLALARPDGGAAQMLLRQKDCDEGCEHIEYTASDDLGIVRTSPTGSIDLREVQAEKALPSRSLTHKLHHDDDVVAVDASPASVLVAFTRDVAGECSSGTDARTTVRAIVARRTATMPETETKLAAAECGTEIGPFWTGFVKDAWVVAWPERPAKKSPIDPPIAGLAFVTLNGDAASDVTRIAAPADALVDAGCDARACYAVAL
ncbi:MAG: hypothetical protein ABIP89_21810, partial [Polyangiaceae bacterium]